VRERERVGRAVSAEHGARALLVVVVGVTALLVDAAGRGAVD